VAVQVALVGEATGGGGLDDRLAGFEQAAGAADPVRELQRMGWQAGVLAEEADEAELANPCGGGELVELMLRSAWSARVFGAASLPGN